MLLTRFFSSEGMNLLPDAYIFTFPHLLYVLFCVATFILLMRFLNANNQRLNRWVIVLSSALLLFLKYSGEAIFIYEWNHYGSAISSSSHPFWDVRTFISFQVCGINNVLLPLVVLFNIKPMKDFVYTSSIIGGCAVLIYPVGVLFGDPLVLTFPMLRTLLVHFLLIFLPLYLIKIGDFKLDSKRWKFVLLGCLAVMAWAMFGNLVIDPTANNMFLMENPFLDGPIPILNQIPNGIHSLVLMAIVALTYIMVYRLAALYERHRSVSL